MDLDTLIERLPAIRRLLTGVHPAVWFALLVAVYLAWQYRLPVARWLGRTFPAFVGVLRLLRQGTAYLVGALIAALAFLVLLPFRLLMPVLALLAGGLERFNTWVVGATEGAGDRTVGFLSRVFSVLLAVLLSFRVVLPVLTLLAGWLGRFDTWMVRAAETAGDRTVGFMSRMFSPAASAVRSVAAHTADAGRALWTALANSASSGALYALGHAADGAVARLLSLWFRILVAILLPFSLALRGLKFFGGWLVRLGSWLTSAAKWTGNRVGAAVSRASEYLADVLNAAVRFFVLPPIRSGARGLMLLGGWLTRLDTWMIGTAERTGDRGVGMLRRAAARVAAGAGGVTAWLAHAVANAVARLLSLWFQILPAVLLPLRITSRGLALLVGWLGRLGTWMSGAATRTRNRAAGALQRASEFLAGVLNAVVFVVLSPLRLAMRGLVFVAHVFARLAAAVVKIISRAIALAGDALAAISRALLAPAAAALLWVLARIGNATARIAARTARWARAVWIAFASSKLAAAVKAALRGSADMLSRGAGAIAKLPGMALRAIRRLALFLFLLLWALAQAGLAVIRPVLNLVLMPLRATSTQLARIGPRTRLAMNGLLAAGALVTLWYVVLPPWPTLRIAAGSGHSSFEPILRKWATANKVNLEMTYKGSLDMMLMLKSGDFPYDAIWEADSLWTSLSGSRDIKNTRSIMCSPIVFGVKRSVAQQLGWIGKTDVHMRDVLAALEDRKLRVLMTSATQSNSGASAYFGFLYAFARQPDLLTADHLADSDVLAQTKRVLATIARTGESSGFLRDLLVNNYDLYDGMFNYESHVIEADQKLAKLGREPLYVVYLQEGLGSADFPFSYVARGNADKEPLVNALQQYLLTGEAQLAIAAKGRRVGPLCNQMDATPPDWGVDPDRTITGFRYPVASIIWDALHLYQSRLRKPSDTVFALDFSASMEGEGKRQLLLAMRTVLDQEEAKRFLLEASSDDVNTVLLFNHSVMNAHDVSGWTVGGNNSGDLERLLGQIASTRPAGRTDIYRPVVRALEEIHARGVGGRLPAIILMTDGESNTGSLDDIENAIARTGLHNVPIYGVTFGDASVAQLEAIAKLTRGRVYDGSKDLISAIKSAKANN